ncbi:ABC transporter permease [Streptomyces sp. HUCO-GS316]|uniref:ABC transporter permease n=1 Tax=Streptomyces sp. HUCO-GS316 TaxID=2692198 RepID=UPI0013680702|nr:ABC transporter permease [Streptomyces sp. HUCO-GS316]MXM68498.1 ABC transporter permease [Streptomyces sp. HUCO-GS316]
MTAIMEAAPPVASTQPMQSWAAVVALARFEGRKLLLRIPVLLALTVYAAWIVWQTRDSFDGFPALQDADRSTQGAPLLVALAVMVCVNQSVLRSRRRDTERHFAVLVLQPGRRTAAHVLSVLPATAVVAACVAVQFTWEALKPGAIGTGSPGELLVGPLSVLLFGAIGVLVARLAPSAVAVPLMVVFFLFLFVFGASPALSDDWTRWLYPVVGESSANILPSDLLGRPAAWHALYLAGLALSVALLAVLIGGARKGVAGTALAGALALTVVGGVGQAAGLSDETAAARVRASVTPEKEQTCVERGRSTYCAFPEWTPRVATWAGVVDHVQSLSGGTAKGQQLLVRQRIEARYGLDSDAAVFPLTTPHQVTVGTAWGGNRVPEFSVGVASVLVAGNEKAAGEMCDGRMVTVMWTALAWESDPVAALRRVRLDDSVTGSAIVLAPTDSLSMTAGQTEVVRQLLEQPRDAVAVKVKAHWAELTDPKVTTGRAAQLLGVAVPKGADKCDG